MQCAKLLIMHAYSSWVTESPDSMEPVALWSSQVLWASKFLTNLKIWLLFGKVLKEIEFLSVSYLNKLERLSFVICLQTEDLLLPYTRHDFTIFDRILTIFQELPEKIKQRKSTEKILEATALFQWLCVNIYIVCVCLWELNLFLY